MLRDAREDETQGDAHPRRRAERAKLRAIHASAEVPARAHGASGLFVVVTWFTLVFGAGARGALGGVGGGVAEEHGACSR